MNNRSVVTCRIGNLNKGSSSLLRLRCDNLISNGKRGTVSSGIHLPKPVQTSSLRKQNGGQDISIDLVRRGSGLGWGSKLTTVSEPEIPNRLLCDAEKNLPEQPSRLLEAEQNQRSISFLLGEQKAQAPSFCELKSESNLVATKSEPEIPNRLLCDAEKNLPEQPSRLLEAEQNQRSISFLLGEQKAQAPSFCELKSESNLVATKSNDDFFCRQSKQDAIESDQSTAIPSIHRSSCRRWERVDKTCEKKFRRQTSYQNLEQTECGLHKGSRGQGMEHVTLNPSMNIVNGRRTFALDENEHMQPIQILRRIKPNDDVLLEKEFGKLSSEQSQKVFSSNIHETLPVAHADTLSAALQSLDVNAKSATNLSRGIASALEQQEIVLRQVILTRKYNTTKRSATSGACNHEISKISGREKEKGKEQVTRMDNQGKGRRKPREKGRSISILSSNECRSQIKALFHEEDSSSKKQAFTAVIEAEDVDVKGGTFSTINEADSPSYFSTNCHQLDSAWKSNPRASFVNANKTLLGSNHFNMPDWSPNVAIFSFHVDNIWSSCLEENREPSPRRELSETDVAIKSTNAFVNPKIPSSVSLVDSKVQNDRIYSHPLSISSNKKIKNHRKASRKKKSS